MTIIGSIIDTSNRDLVDDSDSSSDSSSDSDEDSGTNQLLTVMTLAAIDELDDLDNSYTLKLLRFKGSADDREAMYVTTNRYQQARQHCLESMRCLARLHRSSNNALDTVLQTKGRKRSLMDQASKNDVNTDCGAVKKRYGECRSKRAVSKTDTNGNMNGDGVDEDEDKDDGEEYFEDDVIDIETDAIEAAKKNQESVDADERAKIAPRILNFEP